MAATSRDATVLAFDFGTQRIGVAMGNTLMRVAHPLTTIDDERTDERFAAIAGLVKEWQPATLVVGLPTHADGTEHEMTLRAQRFGRQLEGRFRLPVVMVDERWTTEGAQSVLEAAGMTGRRGRAERDSVAAQLILQSWFDELVAPSDVEQSDGEQNDVERNDVDQNDVDPDAPASANP